MPSLQAAVREAFQEEWGRIVAALIHRVGDWDLAEECAQEAFAEALYREALSLAGTDAERRFLARRLTQITERPAPPT
jgi:predicted RNA polymerase sigma factor